MMLEKLWLARRARVGQIVLDALSVAIAFVWLAPVLWMLSTAFKSNPEIFRLPLHWIPEQPTFAQFTSALKAAPFGRYYMNSLFVGATSTLATLLFASMAGYAFARLSFPGRTAALAGMLSSTMIPFQVLLIPFFILMTTLKLVNTPFGLILAAARDRGECPHRRLQLVRGLLAHRAALGAADDRGGGHLHLCRGLERVLRGAGADQSRGHPHAAGRIGAAAQRRPWHQLGAGDGELGPRLRARDRGVHGAAAADHRRPHWRRREGMI
jgi:hypothetical protein